MFVCLTAGLHQTHQMDIHESKTEVRTITTQSLQDLRLGRYAFQISDSIVQANSEVIMGFYGNKHILIT